ncbi:ribbon-helix-helix protein, CopG family [Actinopolyspora saharensis]|uniref:ribbon-helix-helix protein, CopG family n=1 Tax=Actinopolyspora saharensis TaxID=995062 RepID=UPI003F672FCA
MNHDDTPPPEEVDLSRETVTDQRGRPITEEEADQASQALETEDLAVDEANIVYPRRGRPSLSTPGARSPRVDTRVPHEVKRRLESLARTQHRAESEVVREALEEYLARH